MRRGAPRIRDASPPWCTATKGTPCATTFTPRKEPLPTANSNDAYATCSFFESTANCFLPLLLTIGDRTGSQHKPTTYVCVTSLVWVGPLHSSSQRACALCWGQACVAPPPSPAHSNQGTLLLYYARRIATRAPYYYTSPKHVQPPGAQQPRARPKPHACHGAQQPKAGQPGGRSTEHLERAQGAPDTQGPADGIRARGCGRPAGQALATVVCVPDPLRRMVRRQHLHLARALRQKTAADVAERDTAVHTLPAIDHHQDPALKRPAPDSTGEILRQFRQ